MTLVFAQTTATLAQEFVKTVREDTLESHLTRISEEIDVVINKQQSHYTVFGHWDAITLVYKTLSNVFDESIGKSNVKTSNNRHSDKMFHSAKPASIAIPVENSPNNSYPKASKDWMSNSSFNTTFEAASSLKMKGNENDLTLVKNIPPQDHIKGTTTARSKAGRKPGSTVRIKDNLPPEPLTFVFNNFDEIENTFEPGKRIRTSVPPTETEDGRIYLTPETSNLDTKTEVKSDSENWNTKTDAKSNLKNDPDTKNEEDMNLSTMTEEKNDSPNEDILSPAIHEIKVEKEDNCGDAYDDDTDIEELYLTKDENDSGDSSSNIQKDENDESSNAKDDKGKELEEDPQKNKSGEFKCNLCPYVGKKRINLKDHMKRHRSNYTCEVCDKTFGIKKDYVRHCNRHNKVKKPKVKRIRKRKEQPEEKSEYACDTCPYKTTTRDNLKDHIKRSHIRKFKCKVCEKPFGSKRDVNRHQNYVHGEPKFYCTICQKHYKTNRTYREHLKTHEEGYVKPEFPCDVCNKSFSTKYVLNEHVKVEHLGVRKAYMCPTCGRSFTQKASYHAHATVHLGIRPYVCDTCGKSFSYEKSLREHKYIHESIFRFQCQYCEKAFKQSTSLKLHLRVHEGGKDYICQICGKGFTQKQALERHERIHSGAKPYLCTLCNKTFNDTSIIRRHMILVHKKHSDRWREGVEHTEKQSRDNHPFYISRIDSQTEENCSLPGKDDEIGSSSTEFTSIEKVRWENPPIKFNFSNSEFGDKTYKGKTALDAHKRCVSPTLIIEQDKQATHSELLRSDAHTQSPASIGPADMNYLNPNPLQNRGDMDTSNGSGALANDYTNQMLRWGLNDYQSNFTNSFG